MAEAIDDIQDDLAVHYGVELALLDHLFGGIDEAFVSCVLSATSNAVTLHILKQ